MSHLVTLIPGDGIGPEVTEAARLVVEAAGVAVDWDVQDAGAAVVEREGTTLPERAREHPALARGAEGADHDPGRDRASGA